MALQKDQHSRYWMDESLFEDDLVPDKSSGFDIHRISRLAVVRRAVSNFVSIITNRNDIEVKFNVGKESYTTGNIVVISADEDPESFDVTVGLALHEAAHVLLSDFTFLSGLVELNYRARQWSSGSSADEFRFNIGTEHKTDWRVAYPYSLSVGNNILERMLPENLRTHLQKSGDINSENYIFTYTEMCSRILDIENILEDRRIDSYVYKNAPGYRPYYQAMYRKYFYTKDIGENLKFNPKWRELTVDNYISHLLYLLHPEHKIDSMPGMDEIVQLIDFPNLQKLAPETSTTTSATRFDAQLKYMWMVEMGYDTAPNLFKKACEVYSKILELVAKAKPTKAIDPNAPRTSIAGAGGMEGAPEQSEVGEEEADEQPEVTESGMENLDTTSFGAPSLEPTPVETVTKKGKKATKKNPGTPDTEVEGKFNPVKGEKDKAIADKVRAGDVKKKKITKKQATAVEAVEQADAEIVNLKSGTITGGNCLVIRKVTEKFLEQEWIPFRANFTPDATHKAIAEGKAMGRIMVHRLQVRNDPLLTKQTRLQHGNLDRRLLAQLGMDITSVFQKTRTDIHRPAMLHLSLDASGSMYGDKWNKVVKIAVALAYVGNKLRSVDTVVSIRTADTGMPIAAILFDSRRNRFPEFASLIGKIAPNSATPEGLCFQATQKLISECANTHDVYFINFSDGEPMFDLDISGGETKKRRRYSNGHMAYSGQIAFEHTRTQVQQMREKGITVLSYFITDKMYHTYQNNADTPFQFMYGKDASFINVENIHEVLRTLNGKLIKRG